MKSPEQPFRVLSLDGGGMRGLYSVSVLDTLAQRYSSKEQIDIGKGFDLIVGTSTGGILAIALAAGINLEKVINVYRRHGPNIFPDPMPAGDFKKILWAIKNAFCPANSNKKLRECLNEIFQLETVGQLFARRGIGICVPAVNISTHESRVFKTAHDPLKNADDDRTLVDVCMATSAAPIIFPIATVANPHLKNQVSHFVDGGLWANNPVLVALVEALQVTCADQPIEIVSLGTCPPPSGGAIVANEASRGVFGWNFGVKALELSMDAQASGYQFMAKFLVEHLQKCNRKVKLLRLEQSAPSSEQSNHLGLDNSSEKACSTLMELGNSDGLKLYGKSLELNSPYELLKNIFNSMPKLGEEKN